MILRAHWLEQVTRECQIVLTALISSRTEASCMIEAFRERCPPPSSEIERLVLAGLLSKTYRGASHTLKAGDPAVAGVVDSIRPATLTTIDDFCAAVHVLVAVMSQSKRLSAVEQAHRWILEHPSAKTTVKSVAAVCGIHPRTLSSRFRDAYDIPIRKFIEQTKLSTAVRLLETTDLKLEAVAAELGFSSKITLYRLIRTRLRSSPLEIRLGKFGRATDQLRSK
jgi:AraC-like DNA-binding protein